jgi:hypothetical protein
MYSDFGAFAKALDNGVVPVGRDVLIPSQAVGNEAMSGSHDRYRVRIHNAGMATLLRAEYSRSDIAVLLSKTADIRRIQVVEQPWGTFINAASFDSQDEASATNYDAVWVRDSIWGYYALAAEAGREQDAKAVLLTQLSYLASQSERMDRVIVRPELLDMPEPVGSMNAVHIRFDAQSPDYADVTEHGEAQPWTHKQNDALGLVIAATVRALRNGSITLEELSAPVAVPGSKACSENDAPSASTRDAVAHPALNSRLAGLVRLVAYLHAVKFQEMEDSGAWEEQPRSNTSSIGIVVSALEDLHDLLSGAVADHRSPACQEQSSLARAYGAVVFALHLKGLADAESISTLIEEGYEVLHRQLRMGGESPDYPVDDARYRQADAALLSLIYPCRPKGLDLAEELHILQIVGSLIGDFGIRRYLHDTYQSANFWWHDIKPDADPESHARREAEFVRGTEAEWFFDSWYATCCLVVAKEMEADGMRTGLPAGASVSSPEMLRNTAVRHLNRALGQITGDDMVSADGKPVGQDLLPESYNRIVARHDDGKVLTWAVPSPIAPLNWAKASLTLCLQEFLQE